MATGGSIWARGSAGKAPARRQRVVESFGATCLRGTSSRRWLPDRSMAAAVLNSGGGREAEQAGRLEEGESIPICNFRNFRDPTVKQQ